MRRTQTQNSQLTTSPGRVATIIVLTLIVAIAAVALFSVVAKHHGGVPYEKQTHLKILGITKLIKPPIDPNPLNHVPPDGYDQLHESHPLVALSEFTQQSKINDSRDSEIIHQAITYRGRTRQSDLFARGKVSAMQEPGAQISASDSPVWRETRQWCVRLMPTSGGTMGETLWHLSSVKGASEVGLPPRSNNDFPSSAQSIQLEARYPDGFLLPVQSNAYGNAKGKMTSVFWTLAIDAKICPDFKVLARSESR
jgi:hypothetical protein